MRQLYLAKSLTPMSFVSQMLEREHLNATVIFDEKFYICEFRVTDVGEVTPPCDSCT